MTFTITGRSCLLKFVSHLLISVISSSSTSLSFSIPEEKYNDILKYNKKEPTKLANRIGTLCSELNKQGEYLLFNLSIKLNEKWSEDINIYKTLIHINSENIKESNIYENNYDLY